MLFASINSPNPRTSPESDFFLVVCFLVVGYWVVQKILFFLNEKHKGGSYEVVLFLYYGWFLQNLEKGCIQTNMHTTVSMKVFYKDIKIYSNRQFDFFKIYIRISLK